MSEMNHIARVKVLTLGSSQTGKSCLVKRYCERRFVPKYLPTIGIDYGVTRLCVDNVDARVHIFDTSGRSLFADVRCEFFSGMTGVLLVYDVTNRASFVALDGWLEELDWTNWDSEGGRAGQRPVLVVAGNKIDRAPREVSTEQGELWAAQRGATHYQVSASSGDGVSQLFGEFFQMVVRAAAAGRHGNAAAAPSAASNLAGWLRRLRAAPSDWDKFGLRPGYSKEDVNRTYKSLAVMLHPDKNNSAEAAEAFKLLTTVRNNLLKTFSLSS